MSKRSLKPISKENLKRVIGGVDLPPQPATPNLPRGGWIVPAALPEDLPRGGW
jgi:hypothetical protein